jgi:acetyltransferase-like isoleucine patch superfamily enzyme
VSIGDNVTFGVNNIIQHCDFGSNILVGDSCRFIGGIKKHEYKDLSRPINLQGGMIKKIQIGDDTWIDANSVIMENVGGGSVVMPGSVVREKVEAYSICQGNPAKMIAKRK